MSSPTRQVGPLVEPSGSNSEPQQSGQSAFANGLEGKCHPIGATALAQIFALITQLRGEAKMWLVKNAELVVAENGSGLCGVEEAVCVESIISWSKQAFLATGRYLTVGVVQPP